MSTFLISFGLRFTAIATVAFLIAVVILTALFLTNLDALLAGLQATQDPILIPVREGSVVN